MCFTYFFHCCCCVWILLVKKVINIWCELLWCMCNLGRNKENKTLISVDFVHVFSCIYTHTHTHTHTCIYTLSLSLSHTHMYLHSRTLTHTHTCIYTRAHTHTCVYLHSHTNIYKYMLETKDHEFIVFNVSFQLSTIRRQLSFFVLRQTKLLLHLMVAFFTLLPPSLH